MIEEVVAAGIQRDRPGDPSGRWAGVPGSGGPVCPLAQRFLEQPAPRGYGDALHRAAAFTDGDSFVHLVSDHLYLSGQPRRCAQQLVAVAEAEQCAVSAVQPTRESMLRYYGAVGGLPVPGRNGLYQIDHLLEKPTPTKAEQELIVPGLRAGYYLCLFGMHVLTPAVMELLAEEISRAESPAVMLTPRRWPNWPGANAISPWNWTATVSTSA